MKIKLWLVLALLSVSAFAGNDTSIKAQIAILKDEIQQLQTHLRQVANESGNHIQELKQINESINLKQHSVEALQKQLR